MYFIAFNGGNAFHFIRGLAYTGAYIAGVTTFVNAGSDGTQTSGLTLQNVAIFAHIADGGLSFYYVNSNLWDELQEKYPRHPEPRPPGVGPLGFAR